MAWIILGFLSHLSWAFVNIGDKYLVGNRIKNPYVYMFWLFWTGLIAVLVIPFIDFYVPSARELFVLLLAGLFFDFGGLPYIKAMQMEEATRINIWWSFIPIFSLIIGWLFFAESFTINELIGFVLLVVAGFVGSIHAGKRAVVFSRAVWYMMVAGVAYALYAVFLHQVTQTVSFATAYVWVTILPLPFTLLLLINKKFYSDFKKEATKLTFQTFSLIMGIRIFESLGLFFNAWALSLTSAALVYSLEGSQVIFVFALITIISFFSPKVMKEDLDLKNVILKLSAIGLMLVGILILTFG